LHDHYLSYFANAGEGKPIKGINLKHGRVELCPSKVTPTRKYCLQVLVGKRIYYLASDTQKELDMWMSNINKVILIANKDPSIKEGIDLGSGE
jgi:hypothetical protein